MAYDWNRLTTTADLARDDGVKVLVYGQAGSGKTHLVTTLDEDPGKVLIANADGGTLTIAGDAFPVAPIESFADFEALLTDVAAGSKAGKIPYTWLVVDSLTEIVERCLEVQIDANPGDTWGVYRELGNVMIYWLKRIRDMPGINVYVTAEMGREKTETGRMLYAPRCPGSKTAGKIPHVFDFVFPLRLENNPETGELERWLQTQPCTRYEAKSRLSALGRYEKPDIGAIADKIRDGLK